MIKDFLVHAVGMLRAQGNDPVASEYEGTP
jgi:hypothetical protein